MKQSSVTFTSATRMELPKVKTKNKNDTIVKK